MKATPEMIDAGAEAARKYMEETGGNSPAVIWDAMWAAQPFLPAQEPVDIASIIACREMLDAQPVPARVQYTGEDDDDDTQVYKKPWVGLTDEQRLMALKFIDPKTARLPQGFKQFAETIEKLLKDQNT